MAAASKPTAVHFFLVIFVMIALILAIVTYLTGKTNAELTAKEQQARDDASKARTALDNALNELEDAKSALGYNFEEMGSFDTEGGANTVLGELKSDLASWGRDQAQPSLQSPNVSATLQSLRSALDSAEREVSGLKAGLTDAEARLAQEVASHLENRQRLQVSADSSEQELRQIEADRAERVAKKDQEIAKWQSEFRREQVAKEQIRDELNNVRNEKDAQIRDLENIVSFMRGRLNDLEQQSFDKPDGEIVRVDNNTRTVWINLGSQDNLRPQVSFSVYSKDHQGVGRSGNDIKAKIEVTKIREGNLAEARIVTDEISRPIQAGDPIYSPAWSKSSKEYFSFVGILDLDGDEASDRELLHNILENAGAGIELEVDDEGKRDPEDGSLSVKSKFLVVGDIPDPLKYVGFKEKQDQVNKINEQHGDLTKEALRKGIRIISFHDFLNYMGYEPQQRLFISGEARPFNLKTGTRKTSTTESFESERSSRFRSISPSNSGR